MSVVAILVIWPEDHLTTFVLPHPKDSQYEISSLFGPMVSEMFENVVRRTPESLVYYQLAHDPSVS